MSTDNTKQIERLRFLDVARSHMGRWYIWGGDNPAGFDCSGLTVECLKSVGLLAEGDDLSADGLWHRFKTFEVNEPSGGAMVFYFDDKGKAYHVAICIDGIFCITADGGGARVRTVEDAIQNDAFIKIRPISKRRSLKRFVNCFA